MLDPLLVNLALLALSLVVLAKSSEIVVKNAVEISRKAGMNELAMGFLLVSVSTSLPELAVSVIASLSNNMGLSVGNVFGSNIADICLVIGLGAVFYPMKIMKKAHRDLIMILFMTSFIPIFFIRWPEVSRAFGFILLLLFLVFCYYSLSMRITLNKEVKSEGEAEEPKKIEGLKGIIAFFFTEIGSVAKSLLFFFLGIAAVIVSSNFVVGSASGIAEMFGLSKSVLGATIVAVGTSLPELSVDLTALKNGHVNLALGDVMGSCMVNLTLVLGATLLLSPLAVNMGVFTNLIFFLLMSNLLLWFFLDREKLSKREGAILLALYIMFLVSTLGIQISLLGWLKA